MMKDKSLTMKQPRTKEPVRLGIPPYVRSASAQDAVSKGRTKANADKPRRIKEQSKTKVSPGSSSK